MIMYLVVISIFGLHLCVQWFVSMWNITLHLFCIQNYHPKQLNHLSRRFLIYLRENYMIFENSHCLFSHSFDNLMLKQAFFKWIYRNFVFSADLQNKAKIYGCFSSNTSMTEQYSYCKWKCAVKILDNFIQNFLFCLADKSKYKRVEDVL
jgi:hypothetical protein